MTNRQLFDKIGQNPMLIEDVVHLGLMMPQGEFTEQLSEVLTDILVWDMGRKDLHNMFQNVFTADDDENEEFDEDAVDFDDVYSICNALINANKLGFLLRGRAPTMDDDGDICWSETITLFAYGETFEEAVQELIKARATAVKKEKKD